MFTLFPGPKPERISAASEEAALSLEAELERQSPGSTRVTLSVSLVCLRQKFHACVLPFIKSVCKGKCCDLGSKGSGIMVHPFEEARIRSLGGPLKDGFIVPKEDGRCHFKKGDGSCGIHTQAPIGCVVSPFSINRTNTVIVRNQARLHWPCYGARCGDAVPVYEAHRGTMVRLFGEPVTQALILAGKGEGPSASADRVPASMPWRIYRMLRDNAARRGTLPGPELHAAKEIVVADHTG